MITFQQLGRYGRFGNQLFQIASTIGIATLNGHAYAFPEWINHDALERFKTTEDIGMQKFFVNRLPLLRENLELKPFNASWGYHELYFGNDNFDIIGHLQSEKYFAHCKPLIEYYFEQGVPFKQHEIAANSCAIHVRLGDYENNYHPIQDRSYYIMAMNRVRMLQRVDVFYVYSDEIEKAKVLFEGVPDVIFIDPIDTMTDFYSMRQSDHFIIGNSSYSWWAAWLSKKNRDKVVVAPKKWFGLVAGISSEDIYCENWIVL